MALVKSEPVDEVKEAMRFLAGEIMPDGDAIAGIKQETNEKTTTYELETLDGLLAILLHKAVTGDTAVLYACDENTSLLIMNKCYGMKLDIPVKSNPGKTETLHVFSAILQKPKSRRQLKHSFHAKELVYLPTFGGIVTTADGIVPKPCITDIFTRNIISDADLGWRSLLYTNKGPDDPFPTGIVAFEGWKFVIQKTGTAYDATPEQRKAAFDSVAEAISKHCAKDGTKATDTKAK